MSSEHGELAVAMPRASWPASDSRISIRTATIAWILLGIAVCGKVVVSPERHSLWPVFRHGALGWWRGDSNIYLDPLLHFRYSPVFAALLAPFVALPWLFGNLLFDLGGLALLFYSIRQLTRVVFPEGLFSRDEPAVLLLSLIGVVRCVWSSQAHTWFDALIFLAAVALVERRWWAAAFLLALAVHLKLAPVVLAGGVAMNWPRTMSWRLPAAFGSWAMLPLVRGGPAHAAEMYRDWFERLQNYSTRRWPSFRDVLHVFEISHINLTPTSSRGLQACVGLGVLFWTWRLARRCVDIRWVVSGSFALTITYMLLFGPTVEFVQYPLLAPWVSGALLAAWPQPGRRLALGLVFVLAMICGFGAIEDAIGSLIHSQASEALITFGTLGFGAWIVLAWRRNCPHGAPLPVAAGATRVVSSENAVGEPQREKAGP